MGYTVQLHTAAPAKERLCLHIDADHGSYFYAYINRERGLLWIDGKTGSYTTKPLQEAAARIGASSPVSEPLERLVAWANEYPDGVWEIN